MRIISGSLKGRRLPATGFNARPTTDFARESLFNVLFNYFDFEQCRVLDLFSGTGSIAIEFASRGSTIVELVENDSKNFRLIQQNLTFFNLKQVKAVKADVFKYISRVRTPFNIVFADPPYDMAGIDKLPDLILNNTILKPEGWFILEHSKNFNFSQHPSFREMRNYGAVHFSFFML